MDLRNPLAILIAILFIGCLADLPFTRRFNQTLCGFFLVNGRLRLPGFVASILSANLSIGNFLVFIAVWGYIFGWGGLFWFTVNLILNVVAYLVFMPTFKSYIEDPKNSGTIHEFLATTFAGSLVGNYSQRIRLVASATTILGLLFAVVFELHLATDIFARLLKIDAITIFSVLTALICIYSGIGGFHTLVWTDILQSVFMIAGTLAVIPIFGSLAGLSAAQPLAATYPITVSSLNIGWPSILGISVIGSGWFLVAMDQWQRTCATRDSKRTRGGMLWYLVSIFGFAVVYALMGMYDKSAILPSLPQALVEQHTKGSNPLLDFFLAANIAPSAILFALVAVALLAAAMSTANTFLIVCGHSFVSDLLVARMKGTSICNLAESDSRVFVGIARASIIGMGVFVISAWLVFTKAKLLSLIQFSLPFSRLWFFHPCRDGFGLHQERFFIAFGSE